MPLSFTCPHCGEQTLVDERYAGHEGPCVNCGRIVLVPGDATTGAATAPATPARPASEATRDRTQTTLIAIAALSLVGAILGIGLLLVGPAVDVARATTVRRRCGFNLRQLALAIDAYERDYGSYPPARVIGPDGKAWHSWRVLVLPYLGPQEKLLYQRYDLGQPWDSQHNKQLLSSMPDLYVSPADQSAAALFETSYLAVTGPGMAFGGTRETSSSQIADGLDQTILLVEVREAGIAWTEPRDLDSQALSYQVGIDLGGNHAGGVNTVTADGQPHFVPDTYTPEEIRALMTVAGGEDVAVPGN